MKCFFRVFKVTDITPKYKNKNQNACPKTIWFNFIKLNYNANFLEPLPPKYNKHQCDTDSNGFNMLRKHKMIFLINSEKMAIF